MKHFLLFGFTFLLLPINSTAQITLSPASFPKVGDTLFTAIDNLPTNVFITPPGSDQRWDFTGLQSPFTRQIIVRPVNESRAGSSFPSANAWAELADNSEGYYKISNSTITLVGLYSEDPLDFGIRLAIPYSPPVIERRAPLRYGDSNAFETSVSYPFSTDDLPDQVLENLPITPDSLRIRLRINRRDIVDAWGKAVIPGGIYDVLREKHTEIREVRLDAKLGFLPWQDITDLIPNTGKLGKDTAVSYHYFSNEAIEPIVVLYADKRDQKVLSVQYKSNDLTTNVQDVASLRPGVYAYPNPAIVNVRFEFSNLKPGEYKLTIFNILGVEVWSQRYYINGFRTEKVNISHLRKGTYLYSLSDDRGKTLATKRLIVVKP